MSQHQISIGAAEELTEWFLHLMDQDTRARLMAERPQLYGEIFPDADPAVILARVTRAMDRRCTTCHRSAHTPESTSYHGHSYTGPVGKQASGHYHDPLGTYDYCDDPACPRTATPA